MTTTSGLTCNFGARTRQDISRLSLLPGTRRCSSSEVSGPLWTFVIHSKEKDRSLHTNAIRLQPQCEDQGGGRRSPWVLSFGGWGTRSGMDVMDVMHHLEPGTRIRQPAFGGKLIPFPDSPILG